MSADDCSLLPPPNGLSIWQCKLMLVHTQPFMAKKVFPHTPPQTFYANAIFPHTLDLLWQCTQTLLTLCAIHISIQSIIIIHYPLYDTAMIRGVQRRSRGPLYDTAVIIRKGGVQRRSGGPLYDTAVILCKGVHKRSGGSII